MNKFATTAASIVLFCFTLEQPKKTGAAFPKWDSDEFQPVPEMQRLVDTFAGEWRVSETFALEVGTPRQEKTRQGTVSFRVGPGVSLIEDYRSNGSAGNLRFLGLLWWDQSAQLYRLLTCANNEGCRLRGTAKSEGRDLVNSWEEKVDGKVATFKDSFVDILPTSFRLVSEGTAEGKAIWRVITKYERLAEKNRKDPF